MDKCYYITKTNKSCNIKWKKEYKIDDKYYCKKHFDIINNRNNKSDKSNKSNESDKSNKSNESNESNNSNESNESKNLNIHICSYITKTGRTCTIKAKSNFIFEEQYYCKRHFDQINNSKNKINSQQKDNNQDNNQENNQENNNKNFEKIEIIKSINLLKNKLKYTYNLTDNIKKDYKKQIFKLLLKVHPDKCIIKDINCHEITQDLTLLLQKLKV